MRLLFAEVKKQGYTGSYNHLARFIAPWKDAGRLLDGVVETPLVLPLPALASLACAARSVTPTLDPTTGRRVSPLTAAALCVQPRGQMTSRQSSIVDALKARSEEFITMRQLTMRLKGLFRERSAEKLDEWLRDAFSAKTLRQDKSEVQSADRAMEQRPDGGADQPIEDAQAVYVWSRQRRIASRAHATASRLQSAPRVNQTLPRWLRQSFIGTVEPCAPANLVDDAHASRAGAMIVPAVGTNGRPITNRRNQPLTELLLRAKNSYAPPRSPSRLSLQTVKLWLDPC